MDAIQLSNETAERNKINLRTDVLLNQIVILLNRWLHRAIVKMSITPT